MPLNIHPQNHILAKRILKISEHYQILNVDNVVNVCIDCFQYDADYVILDNLKYNDKLKDEYRIKNLIIRNYESSGLFQFHVILNNSIIYYQNWDELINHATELMMEEVCFARN